MDQRPLDLIIELTAPPQGSPPAVIATITLRCSDPINLGPISAGLLTDPFLAGERDKLQWHLEEYWKHADDEAFSQASKEVEDLLPQIGKRLYKQVLEGHSIVYSWQFAPAQRHQITIHSDIPGALNLPWELLHDQDGFLALRPTKPVSVVRHFPQNSLIAFPTSFTPPLRVLLVTSRPKDVKFSDPRSIALEMLDEVQNLVDAGNIKAGDIELEFLRPPTLHALTQRLSNGPLVHVLHFDGHGDFNENNKRGELFFEQDDGTTDKVDAEHFRQVIQGGVGLVVMTACKSDVGSIDDAFSSVATRLIQGGIDAVVAMSASVLVTTAIRYTEEFYRALFARRSIFIAQGQSLQALHADKRRSLLRHKRDSEEGSVKLLDWWVPHYYQQRPLELQPAQPVRKGKKREVSRLASRLYGMPPEPHYGFSGRSHELLDLERLLRDGKLVVVHGFCGVGKTAFVREAVEWLTRTNMYTEAHFISREHYGSGILSELERLTGIQEKMRVENRNMLVIVESVEGFLPDSDFPLEASTYSRLWSVLLDLADKKAGVVLTTSDLAFGDGRLAPGRRVAYLPLKGLRPEDAYVLAKSVLSSLKIDQKRTPYPALTDLLAYLDHHPLAIQLMLPLLEKDVSLLELRNAFYKHLPLCVDDDDNRIMTERRHHSLTRFLEEAPLQGLIQRNQALLSHLVLFEGGASRSNLLEITEIAEAKWSSLEKSLERVQLLLPELIQGNDSGSDTVFLCFHPMLIPYLRLQFGTGDEPLRERYIQCYSRLSKEMHRKDKRAVAKRELSNLKYAVRLALEMGKLETAREIAHPVCRLLCRTDRLWECGVLLQWVADATVAQNEPDGGAKG
jgi:hypothetical protein